MSMLSGKTGKAIAVGAGAAALLSLGAAVQRDPQFVEKSVTVLKDATGTDDKSIHFQIEDDSDGATGPVQP